MNSPFTHDYSDFNNNTFDDAHLYPYSNPEYRELPRLRRQLSCLWTYIIEQELWEEALEFMNDHREDPLPFDLYPYEA